MSVELLAAGVDTTANSFLIVLFNVAGNKEVQRKARQGTAASRVCVL